MTLKISAIVCTYDRYSLLDKCLESLRNQSLPVSQFEILVVDNSPDEARSYEHKSEYRHINNLRWFHEKIPGLSNARNVGVSLASGPLVAYLDDDAIADPTWLENLVKTFERLGECCHVVGGRVRPIWSEQRPDWLDDSLLGYVSVVDLSPESRFLRDDEWIAGANIAYRRPELLNAGGFDTNLGRVGAGSSLMSGEEVALTNRIKAAGGRIAYDPDAAVNHLVEPNRLTQTWFRKRIAWQAVSDCVGVGSNPGDIAEKWADVRKYFLHQPPSDRTVRALFMHTDNVGDLKWQMGALYNFIVCVLNGLEESRD